MTRGTRQGAQGGNTGSIEWTPQARKRVKRVRHRQEERWAAKAGPVAVTYLPDTADSAGTGTLAFRTERDRLTDMKQLGSDEARRTFRDLLDDAQQGESTEISRNGKPVAILIPAGDSAMKIPPAGHAITIELPGLTAIRIDTAGRVVAIDCISGVANDAEPLSPEWLVRDLRDGTYGGFHRLKPADECFDTECAASGQHVDPANLEIGDPAAGTTETAGANPKLEDFAAPGFAAVRTFKAQGDETP